jgi:hypothetical protein
MSEMARIASVGGCALSKENILAMISKERVVKGASEDG